MNEVKFIRCSMAMGYCAFCDCETIRAIMRVNVDHESKAVKVLSTLPLCNDCFRGVREISPLSHLDEGKL